MFTYLDHAVINWAILHEALIVIVKQRFIKVDLEVNFHLERLQTWNLLNFESSNELTWAYMIYEQIEQTFWNPFWKAYPKTMTIQRVISLWISDINGNWIWIRREKLLHVLIELDAIETQHNTWLILKASYHFRQRNPEILLKLDAGFSQRTTAT
jgi:hypothetical protein